MSIEQRIEQAKSEGIFVEKFYQCQGIDEEKGIVNAVISAKTVDRDGEVVLPKSFEKDMEYYLNNPVVLFAHNYKDPPIAQMTDYKITDETFTAQDQFAVKEYPFAKTIFNLYAGGYMRAFSVGFQRLETSDAEDDMLPGQRGSTYTRSELLEHSAVPIPANRQALVKIYEEVQNHWDETILGYLDKLIEQPQTLSCGHKATYDYEGNVIEYCRKCELKNSYIWSDGSIQSYHDVQDGSSWNDKKGMKFFFVDPPSNSRLASLEQSLADMEEEDEGKIFWDKENSALVSNDTVILSAKEIVSLPAKEIEARLNNIAESHEINLAELKEIVSPCEYLVDILDAMSLVKGIVVELEEHYHALMGSVTKHCAQEFEQILNNA